MAEALLRRVGQREADLEPGAFRAGLARLFPEDSPGASGPRVAAVLALLSRVSVISGGPGTGKTSTVAKILALLQEQALARGREPYRVELLAPTGKAAQRLGEAIRKYLTSFALDPLVAASVPAAAK